MNRQVKRKRNKVFIFALLFLIMACLLFPAFCKISSVSADSVDYTDVLTDLQKDVTFDVGQYPVIQTDYSLQVIQIAESVNNELFVYTYQPNGFEEMHASSINISTGIDEELNYTNYTLTFLGSESVFFKYKVDNFLIKTTNIRYYDISSIFRKFNTQIDTSLGHDNDLEEVAFPVNKIWTASDYEGNVVYTCIDNETLVVEDKYVGFFRVTNGGDLANFYGTDVHFIAFSTDKPLDKLLQANVFYTTQSYTQSSLGFGYNGSPQNSEVTITYTDKFVNTPKGIVTNTYSCDRIQSVVNFMVDNQLSSDVAEAIANMDWVLNFTDTDFTFNGPSASYSGTYVKEVTILRLKFETNGVVYNLGVIDNKQAESRDPANYNNNYASRIIGIVIGVIIGFVVLVLLLMFCPQIIVLIFKGIAYVIVWICKGLWWLITLPFKMFKKEK